jgi:hypothetical protein
VESLAIVYMLGALLTLALHLYGPMVLWERIGIERPSILAAIRAGVLWPFALLLLILLERRRSRNG